MRQFFTPVPRCSATITEAEEASVQRSIIARDDDDIVDYGTAPVTFAQGFARVEFLGENTMFALWMPKTTVVNQQTERFREVVHYFVLPTDAIGPGIELTFAAIPTARLALSSAAHVMRKLTS